MGELTKLMPRTSPKTPPEFLGELREEALETVTSEDNDEEYKEHELFEEHDMSKVTEEPLTPSSMAS